MAAKEPHDARDISPDMALHGDRDAGCKPLLMVDIDGVISLFGFVSHTPSQQPVEGSFHSVEGILHFLSSAAAAHLLALSSLFDLVWASGWEEKANEHLPHLLGLPPELPFLRFPRGVAGTRSTKGHWKLSSIEAYAGKRPLAWIDDALDQACQEWAQARSRSAPTLLVQTDPERGLTALEAEQLAAWAEQLKPGSGSVAG